ncbi:MAG: MAPEG family protein [Shimia sp.]
MHRGFRLIFTVTALYAAALGLVYLTLTTLVIRRRQQAGVSLGDGGDSLLNRRIRGHGNFTETVPIALILLALLEVQAAPALALHVLGAMLLVGRVLHGAALMREAPWPLGRIGGMGLTLTMILLATVGFFVALLA